MIKLIFVVAQARRKDQASRETHNDAHRRVGEGRLRKEHESGSGKGERSVVERTSSYQTSGTSWFERQPQHRFDVCRKFIRSIHPIATLRDQNIISTITIR